MAYGKTQQICKQSFYHFQQKRWKKLLKKFKHRSERRRAKKDPECQPKYGKYSGWEP